MTKVYRTWTDEKIFVFTLFVEILFAVKTVDIYFRFLSFLPWCIYYL